MRSAMVVAEAGAGQDEEQRRQQHAAIERVDLRVDVRWRERERHGQDRRRRVPSRTGAAATQVLEVADPFARHGAGFAPRARAPR